MRETRVAGWHKPTVSSVRQPLGGSSVYMLDESVEVCCIDMFPCMLVQLFLLALDTGPEDAIVLLSTTHTISLPGPSSRMFTAMPSAVAA